MHFKALYLILFIHLDTFPIPPFGSYNLILYYFMRVLYEIVIEQKSLVIFKCYLSGTAVYSRGPRRSSAYNNSQVRKITNDFSVM